MAAQGEWHIVTVKWSRMTISQWTVAAGDEWHMVIVKYYNMIVWILAGNCISFTIAAGLIRLHMPGVKKSLV